MPIVDSQIHIWENETMNAHHRQVRRQIRRARRGVLQHHQVLEAPDLLQRLTRAALSEHAGDQAEFAPGDLVEFTAPNGGRYSGVLKEINEDWALFDFNHPLAGRTLRVDVDLLGVL